ncbi:MAG: hypothetical protein KKB21_04305 [Nanoarchaeota archaeon]|nr:hypothetical protein [Nanoarchaeota archaeon]
MTSRRSQVSVFIIIAIVIVGAVIAFFLLRDKIGINNLPASFRPIEQYYLDCLSEKADSGKEILGEHAGWIELPTFEQGSSYAPFSSQFDFLGTGVPYWNYLSNNNIWREQVPSRQKMEEQLARYIEKESAKCTFEDFEAQGFVISNSEPNVDVKISDYDISIRVNSDLIIEKESENAMQSVHEIQLNSKLGKLYSEALEIYMHEKQNMFLESYSIDVLRLYAPVDGVEISCSPKIWMPQKVVSDLREALEANIQAIRAKGNYYKTDDSQKYFIVNEISTSNAVNFIYSKNWPSRVEIWPVESNIMRADPVGNQEGLGVLGFCYVPYHFVYDLSFPVLVQVYDSKEIFQFPVAVIIDKNKAREAVGGDSALEREDDLCNYRNSNVIVYTYDSKLNPVEADISFKCFDTECDIGKTISNGQEAILSEKFPQCVNGFILARAEGYSEKKYMISTNSEVIADVVLDKLHNVSVEVRVDDKIAERALVYFKGEHSVSLVWPEQREIQIAEGDYNITMYVYRNSSLIFPASSTRKCVDVPKPGLLGLFGGKSEQCYNIDVPSQQVTSVLAGGGKGRDYFTEDRLEKGSMIISGESLPVPASLEELQKNYESFEGKIVYIS